MPKIFLRINKYLFELYLLVFVVIPFNTVIIVNAVSIVTIL